MTTTDPRRRALLLCLIVLTWTSGMPVVGQALRVHAPERISPGREAGLFLSWEGRRPFEGGVLTLPPGWELRTAYVARNDGARGAMRLRRLQSGTASYQLVPETPESGPLSLIVRALAPRAPGLGSWTFTPYRLVQTDPGSFVLEPDVPMRLERALGAAEGPVSGNRALSLRRDEGAVFLTARRLPDLSTTSAFTVETWLRSAETDQIVLSTWNGEEASPYAIELIIDAQGHAVFFQGMRGDHRSMRSRTPVADGGWHHVALTHDPERGWARLILDGAPQDSVHHVVPLGAHRPTMLALGGRIGDDGAARFEGDLDELRVWGLARTPRMVQSTLYRHLPQPAAGAVFLPFDEAIPAELLANGATRVRRIISDLSFARTVADFGVTMDPAGVTLSWKLPPNPELRLVIERSDDGTRYEPVGSMTGARGTLTPTGDMAFTFRDEARETVAFYRIRQVRRLGGDIVSNALKVGRNDPVGQPQLAVLEGSFPNPFNPRTTIRYVLKEGQEVNVSVWDLSGQLVSILHEGFQEAGDYSVSFSAESLPSGTYFVRMKSPEGIQSHPILLMK